MITIGYIGPKEQWQVELEKVNKHGLLHLIDLLVYRLSLFTVRIEKEDLLKSIRIAKKYGRTDAALLDYQRMQNDPDRYFAEMKRRSTAAKRSARSRKKART